MLEQMSTNREGWAHVAFGDVVEKVSNSGIPDAAESRTYIGLEHMSADSYRIRKWGSDVDIVVSKTRIKKGDVLFARRNTHLRRCAVAPFDAFYSPDGYAFRAKSEKLSQEYLLYLVGSTAFMDFAVANSAGTHSKRVKWTDLQRFEFLLPPIQEQARLVEAFIANNALAEALLEAQERCEGLFRSLLRERMAAGLKPKAYQGFVGTEQTLRTVALSEIAMVDRGKFSHRPRNLPQFFGGPFPFAQTGDVGAALGRKFVPSQTLSEEGRQYSRSFPAGSILTTIAAVIAATAITTEETWCTDSIVGIVPNRKEDVDFIEYAMRYTRPYLEYEVATQTAQKNINLEILRPLRLPWPECETRSEIVRELSSVEARLLDLIKRREAAIDLSKLVLSRQLETPQ